MLALGANVALLLGLSRLHALPFTAYGLAFVLSFNGSLAVKDKGATAQAVTRCYAGIGAFVAVSAATALSPWPVLADLAFLVVIFGAVYLRRFGLRWAAVGITAVMAYFMGNYTRPAFGDLPWLAVAIAISLAVTHVITTVVLRDDPAADFRRALGSLDQLIDVILEMLAAPTPLAWPKLQAQLNRMRDVVMMAEGLIPQGEGGGLAPRGAASDLAVALFDLQLGVERLVRASFTDRPSAASVEAVRRGSNAVGDATLAGQLLVSMQRARAAIDAALQAGPFASPRATTAARPAAPDASWWKDPQLQIAIQVTLACGIAMAFGIATSPSRWYWAVITAFLVFNNTNSRADTAVRALQRSLGTMAGLVGGTILATLVHGQVVVTAVLMPVCFFLAFYYLQVSYSVMIFFITLALALLYGLTGSFSPELLVLRLEETVIGSAAGSLVAFLVFPVRTETGIIAALDKYLDALRDVIRAARARALAEAEPQHLLARSRLLDRAYSELAVAVRPIGGPWGAVTRFGQVRARLLLLSGITHWARVLARSLPAGVQLEKDVARQVVDIADALNSDIDGAAGFAAHYFDRPDDIHMAALRTRTPSALADAAEPVLALITISVLLGRATPQRENVF